MVVSDEIFMTPAQRIDIISHALLYYGIKTTQKRRESYSQYELYLL